MSRSTDQPKPQGFTGFLSNALLLQTSKQVSDDEDQDEEEEDDFFDGEKFKQKLVAAWNNVKYGFSVPYKPSFKNTSPVWLLGKCYHARNTDFDDIPAEKDKYRVLSMDEFFDNFSSLIWLTYRKEFPQLQNSTLTSDCGWGCMLRTGQMLLANCLLKHLLKDNWNKAGKFDTYEHSYVYRMILRFFNDEPTEYSPFSLHKLVEIGERSGRKAGDWYGPSSVAHILGTAMRLAAHPYLESMCVYVAQDCTVYIEDVMSLCTSCSNNCTNSSCKDKTWRSPLILVPVRLGGECINPIYGPCIKALLTLDYCIGIIGGRPKHSLYFVGFQDNKLVHLDPHFVQAKVDMTEDLFPVESFHCEFPRKVSVKKMDPSCSIGFYCRTRADFETFCEQTAEVLKPPLQRSEYPMFIFAHGKNPARSDEFRDYVDNKVTPQTTQGSYERTKMKRKNKVVNDEYVFI